MGALVTARLAVCCLALVACGAVHPQAADVASSGREGASGARTSSPPASAPSAAASASPPPIVSTSLPCRIPIADVSEARGWFITYPGGRRQDDASSVVALPGGKPGQIGANPGLTYDHQAGTWVPVPYEWLAPGGGVYIDTEDDGVYTTRGEPGAWFIPFDGMSRQVVDHGYWERFNTGALWGFDHSGNLIRHDVGTGFENVVTTLTGWIDIVGFDVQGDPLVIESPTTPSSDPGQMYYLVLVHLNGSRTVIWSVRGTRPVGRAIGDGHGVWFEVGAASGLIGRPGSGLYLWTVATGARLISSPEANLAGACW